MQVGDLVLHIHSTYDGIGIIIGTSKEADRKMKIVTVHWITAQPSKHYGTYYSDELEAL